MTSEVVEITTLPTIRRGRKFKRLTMLQRKVMVMHLSSMPCPEIDSSLDKSPGFARSILNSDKVKRALEAAYRDYDIELKALTPQAIDTFRRNMVCGDPAVEVRAGREVLLINGKYQEAETNRLTAEDVVERVMERISPDGTRTRYAEKRVLGANRSVHNRDTPSSE